MTAYVRIGDRVVIDDSGGHLEGQEGNISGVTVNYFLVKLDIYPELEIEVDPRELKKIEVEK